MIRHFYRNPLLPSLFAMLAVCFAAMAQSTTGKPEVLVIDAAAPAHPFPHFWEHMFGSGRASLSLRESYRLDLRQVKEATAAAGSKMKVIGVSTLHEAVSALSAP